MTEENKAPVPPFTAETAAQKVRMAEDAWNSRNPDRVVLVSRVRQFNVQKSLIWLV